MYMTEAPRVLHFSAFIIIGSQSSYKQQSVLFAPIHMDNVACYGSEDKLTDCTYHTDTSEDVHKDDIWINCNKRKPVINCEQPTSVTNDGQSTNERSKSDTPTNTTALVVLLVGLAITTVVIGLLIGYIVYKHKRNSGTATNR